MVQVEPLRMDPRALRDEVAREVALLIAQAEHEDDHAIADQLVEEVQADGLGVDGLERRRTPAVRHHAASTSSLYPRGHRMHCARPCAVAGTGSHWPDRHAVHGHGGGA